MMVMGIVLAAALVGIIIVVKRLPDPSHMEGATDELRVDKISSRWHDKDPASGADISIE
jgi:hypothetical protein